MDEKLNPNWIADGKSQLAQFFDVSVNTVSNWLLRGCPTLEAEGRNKYRFYLPAVVGWLSLGGPSDADEPAELSIERARLARAQTEKSKVETELKKAQLGAVLAGGMIPKKAARELFQHGEIALMQTIGTMTIQVPMMFLESDHLDHITDPVRRLQFIIDPYRFQTRDDFRRAWEHLFQRYAGDPYGADTTGDDNGESNDAD